MQVSSIKYIYIVVEEISRTFSSCSIAALHLLNNSPLLLPPSPDNHHSTFYIYEFDYFRYFIQMESYTVIFVTGLFHLTCLWRFIHIVACDRISFLFKAAEYSIVCYTTFVYSSFGGHLGWFHLLAVVYSAAMNIALWPVFSFFGYIFTSGIAGLFYLKIFEEPWYYFS